MKSESMLTSAARVATRGMFGLLGVALLLFGVANANAACGRFNGFGSKSSVKLPAIKVGDFGYPALVGETPKQSIVGLWHVIYTTGSGNNSSTFNDTFDTWHSDGTEFETAYLAPVGGDVCVGVWKQTGPHTFVLHHVGWLFNPLDSNGNATNLMGNATNYFTLDETIVVAPNGESYTGHFTFKIWNLDGTFTGVEVPGAIAATRITVN